jgi:hypothetical protein
MTNGSQSDPPSAPSWLSPPSLLGKNVLPVRVRLLHPADERGKLAEPLKQLIRRQTSKNVIYPGPLVIRSLQRLQELGHQRLVHHHPVGYKRCAIISIFEPTNNRVNYTDASTHWKGERAVESWRIALLVKADRPRG